MGGFFVFGRCWQGFFNSFCYEAYNPLPDDQIRAVLLRDARQWYREHSVEAESRRAEEMSRLAAAMTRQKKLLLPRFPIPPKSRLTLPKVLFAPLDVETAPFWSLAWLADWVQSWSPPESHPSGFSPLSPSHRLPILQVACRQDAEAISAALQLWADRHDIAFANPRFEVVAAEEIGAAAANYLIKSLKTNQESRDPEVGIWELMEEHATALISPVSLVSSRPPPAAGASGSAHVAEQATFSPTARERRRAARQRKALQLHGEGLTNSQIAARLDVSEATVSRDLAEPPG